MSEGEPWVIGIGYFDDTLEQLLGFAEIVPIYVAECWADDEGAACKLQLVYGSIDVLCLSGFDEGCDCWLLNAGYADATLDASREHNIALGFEGRDLSFVLFVPCNDGNLWSFGGEQPQSVVIAGHDNLFSGLCEEEGVDGFIAVIGLV